MSGLLCLLGLEKRIRIDRFDLKVLKRFGVGNLLCASIVFSGPQFGAAAVSVANPKVVKVDRVGAWNATAEDKALLPNLARCVRT